MILKGDTAPGSASICALLTQRIILVGEVLKHLMYAVGVGVEKVTLAEQPVGFMLSLIEGVSVKTRWFWCKASLCPT